MSINNGGIGKKIVSKSDLEEYNRLAAPSQNNPVEIYQLKDENLFDQIIMKYMHPKRNEIRYVWQINHRCFSSTKRVKILPSIMMLFTGIGIIALISYFKRWKWLWNEWLTTVDPKRIGIMYIVVVFMMFFKGFADALMMRLQQALSVGDAHGFISAGHFQEVFSAHGTTMIFFVGMGVVFGLMNLIVPLQIGARDVAFPFLNALGFWLFASAAILSLVSLAIRKIFSDRMACLPSLSGIEYSPGEGVDYWIWMVQIAGVGSTISGINFLVTILKMRCPGMTLMKMPIFVWSALCAMVLVIFAFPILTATLVHAHLRPLPRDAFFYCGRRGQSDDVCQSHLGLGTS